MPVEKASSAERESTIFNVARGNSTRGECTVDRAMFYTKIQYTYICAWLQYRPSLLREAGGGQTIDSTTLHMKQ